MNNFIDKNKTPIFVCIGTPKSTLDSIAPRVGTKLKELGYEVIGTLEEPLHALNLKERYEKEIEPLDKSKVQIIAIDATLDFNKRGYKRKIHIDTYPIRPGKGAGKDLPHIGDVSIRADVSYHYNNEFMFLKHLLEGTGDEKYVEELVQMVIDEITECYKLNENPVNTFQAFG